MMRNWVSDRGLKPKPVHLYWCEQGEDQCLRCTVDNLDRALDRVEKDATRLHMMIKTLQFRVCLAWILAIIFVVSVRKIAEETNICNKDCSSWQSVLFLMLNMAFSYLLVYPLLHIFPKSLLYPAQTLHPQYHTSSTTSGITSNTLVLNMFGAPTYQGAPQPPQNLQCVFRAPPTNLVDPSTVESTVQSSPEAQPSEPEVPEVQSKEEKKDTPISA
jgi:hypothetical protein